MKRADTCVLNLLFQVRLGKGSKKGVEMASSQLVEIQPSVVVLFRRGYLIVRMVAARYSAPNLLQPPLAKLIFIKRPHVSLMISVASISLHQHLHSL